MGQARSNRNIQDRTEGRVSPRRSNARTAFDSFSEAVIAGSEVIPRIAGSHRGDVPRRNI